MEPKNLTYINFTENEIKGLFYSAKSGDNSAFEQISAIVRHLAHTYFTSKYRLGKIANLDDVDDLSNEVFLTFAKQYQNIENLEKWLRRVLFLTFAGFYKKNKERKTYNIDDFHHLEDKDNSSADKIDTGHILSYIEKLSDDKQKLLKMRFWEELKFSEIAQRTNKSEDAVKKMFYRTIEELKKIILSLFVLLHILNK